MASIFRLRTLGALDLQAPDGSELRAVLAQPRRVALLVYLALATPRGAHRRDRLLTLFWPEQDEARARNALNQAVYFLRRTLDADAIVSRTDDDLALDRTIVWCDAVAFEVALDAGRPLDAVELYRGELLSGFHMPGATPEFGGWLDETRAALARKYAGAVETLASEREAARDHAGAVVWRRRLAAQDPYNSDAALKLMKALAASGDPGGAIKHARVHETLLRDEMGAPPDRRIAEFVRLLQAPAPNDGAVARASAPRPEQPRSVDSSNAASSATVPAMDAAPVPPSRPPARRPSLMVAAALGALFVVGAGAALVVHARAPKPPMNCVAVLPLANLSGDASLDYVADAVTDALITELARYERLSVISRTSVARYKSTKKSVVEIAHDLNCGSIVEGNVAPQGSRIEINAQLVDAPADRHLWAERYDRDVDALFPLERDIAESIALQLHATNDTDAAASTRLAPVRRVDPIAYGLYLRGRDAAMGRNAAGLGQSITFYQQALARDSTFALGVAGLSDSYRLGGGSGFLPLAYLRDSARATAARALALDGSLSEAHTSLGGALTDAGEWSAADREFRRAIELEPSNALAHHWYATLLITLDRKQEALREIRRARELDPLSQPLRGTLNQIENYIGLRKGSPKPLRPRSELVDPTHPGTLATRSVVLARQGRCTEAYAENQAALDLAPGSVTVLNALVGVRLFCGDRAGALSLFDEIKHRPDAPLAAVYFAMVHVQLQQSDSAFAWLHRAQWTMATQMELRTSPYLKPLRSDPRYRQVLDSLGLP